MATIKREYWTKDVKEILFSGNNQFITHSTSHDAFANGGTVNVPQAGTIAGATKNRTLLPAVVSQRTDTNLTYDLDDYTTDPILIPNIEKIQRTYQLRQSVLGHHMETLKDRMALETVYAWSTDTTASQVQTTGSSVSDNLAPGATGTRAKITVTDIKGAKNILDEQNIPAENRFMMLPSVMYNELFDINDLLQHDIVGNTTLPRGVIAKILGFNVLQRSRTVIFDSSNNRVAIGAATATTHDFGALCWHAGTVARAQGNINVLHNDQDATYFGDVLSAQVQFAAAKLRTGEEGVVSIIQA